MESQANSDDWTDQSKLKCSGNFKKTFLKFVYSAKGFLTFFSFYIFFQSLVASGYTAAISTSIEQRYSLKTTEIGAIVSAVDIGILSVVVFVSWLGGKGNRARWVASGAILVACGSALFTLPQWIGDQYHPSGSDINDLDNDLCSNSTHLPDCIERTNRTNIYFVIFLLSNLLIGIGSSPIYTLGTTYVHDAAPPKSAPVYVSIVYLVGAIGPAAGYIIGGVVVKYWVDPFTDPPVDQKDSRWVGQWWLGLIISAVMLFISAIPLFLYKQNPPIHFDSQLESTNNDDDSDINEELINNSQASSQMSFGASLSELPSLLLNMAKNKIFVVVSLTACCEFSIVVAFLTYMPKYIQDQFSMDPSRASILCGAILLPAAGFGIMTGGFIIRRLDLKMLGCSRMALISSCISFLLLIPAFFFTCGNVPIAGVTVNYPVEAHSISPHGELPVAECNKNCHCGAIYQPICWDEITYQNLCLAGCTVANKYNNTVSNCSCISDDPALEVSIGACEKNCWSSLIPYLVVIFCITMVTCCAQTPAIFITLRCVDDEERPIAMGCQYLLLRLLAYIPTPIYFGRVIDSACIIWDGENDECETNRGACAVYSPSKFRHIYFGLTAGIKLLAVICSIALYHVVYKRPKKFTRSVG